MAWQPDYVTLAEMKAYLRILDTDDDALLALWVTTASRAVDTFCHRQFGKVDAAEARTFTPVWDRHCGRYVAQVDDLSTAAGLTVADSTAVAVTDYELGPVNAPQKSQPYLRLLTKVGGTLTVTGVWGWPTVPAAVKTATLLQAARFSARRDSPYGIAGSPNEGSEMRLLASLDPDLKTALGSKYRREWWAA